MDKKLQEQLRKFKLAHYENLDVGYWLHKLDGLYVKFHRLKNPAKQGRLTMELYATYLQLLEILFINAYAVGRPLESFPDSIFIESANLKKFIEKNFLQETKYSNWFFDNYVFLIQQTAHDKADRQSDYENTLKECAKDYLDNYQLLNAYKHGYRVVAKHGKNSMSLVDKHGENRILVECDSEITYFSKEILVNPNDPTLKGKRAIYMNRISFNNGRIFGKAALVTTLLQNTRLTVMSLLGKKPRDKVMQLQLDKKAWKDSFGGFSYKEPLFSIAKPKSK